MSTSQDSALQEDISAIEDKRQVLEQIVNIAQTIENLQVSLESVLVLGESSKDLPDKALDLYSSISENLRNLPVKTIKEYLKNIEVIIKTQLGKILHYSGAELSSDESIEFLNIASDNSKQTPLEILEDFKRTAQTAVSLRVLLRRRGVATEGSTLPVPKEVITKQITHLEVQEKKQRGKIRDKIVEMKDDIAIMIKNPTYPAGMKEILKGVEINLENDLNSIDKGLKLSSLSFVTDTDEITGLQDEAFEEQPKPTPKKAKVQQEVGMAEAASRWLNSPVDVSWDKAKQSN